MSPVSRFLAVLVMVVCPIAAAQADDAEVVLKHGTASGQYERTGVALRLGPLWSDAWNGWRLTLRPEVEASRFRHAGSGDGPRGLDQGGVIGLLRVHYGEGYVRPYAEGGLGVALFSRDKLGDKGFSTHFQFSEHVGLGIELARRCSVGWQFSHYSNADIELPNDGIDLHQIVVGMRF